VLLRELTFCGPERIRLVFSSSIARTSSSLLPSSSHVSSLRRHFFLMADSVQSPSENLASPVISSWLSMSERSSGGLLGVGASSLSTLKPGTPVYLLGFVMVRL
jgi:hypothetical protein